MPFYLYQAAYKDPQIKALVETPQNREAIAREGIESFGGKLHQFFFAFGEWDVIGIMEFPDNETAAAAVLKVTSTGVHARSKTTVLITPAEAERAMRKAKETKTNYRPPTG